MSRFQSFQMWRRSRMNVWQMIAESIIPSFSGDIKEWEEFDRLHDENGYPKRTPEQEASYQSYLRTKTAEGATQ